MKKSNTEPNMPDSMESHSTILVVDNEVTLLDILKVELTDAGYNVLTAEDGTEALPLIRSSAVDLVVLDLNMPKMNGFEVLQFIKSFNPRIKVIVLTGHADLTNAIRCKKMGADSFLPKPYSLLELLMEIEKALTAVQA